MFENIDFSQPSLWIAAASIIFNPTFWNFAARQEYHHKVITKLFGGNPKYGCYGLAATIFSLGILRDTLYHSALSSQPTSPTLTGNALVKIIAVALFINGNIFVLSSMWALGVTGTYLGDYFGILMDHRVESFPFDITDAPMYWGSTMSFLGTALWYGKPAGVVLTLLVYWCYRTALKFEDPFTAEIYAKRERERAAKEEGKKAK
ncbi:phosphatidylethanolamine N-methyltransferase [Aulographum hederae CBS 113979]|uniref:Phosphatidyl-N-methylethanolamine N-methyltransferase n=1 Tax=Aulographum hederae CBS 113979 TaxID=1176131 RepID=A0A6G1H8M1_9PEZI|nr:phosphatidylethanolamine N-methyltransferase [Aulographum hederae CBS 113979]